jgi:hypothetical protein
MFLAYAEHVASFYDVMIFYGLFVRSFVARVMSSMMYIDFTPESQADLIFGSDLR